MFFYVNIHDKFVSTNITYNLKAKKSLYTSLCMKKVNDIFPTEIVEDVCPHPGAGQTCPFPLLPTCSTSKKLKKLFLW